jgi:hypothetical protein
MMANIFGRLLPVVLFGGIVVGIWGGGPFGSPPMSDVISYIEGLSRYAKYPAVAAFSLL